MMTAIKLFFYHLAKWADGNISTDFTNFYSLMSFSFDAVSDCSQHPSSPLNVIALLPSLTSLSFLGLWAQEQLNE
jgi:hypothetical protein